MVSSLHRIKSADIIESHERNSMLYRKSTIMILGGTGPTYWNGVEGLKIPKLSAGARACRVCE